MFGTTKHMNINEVWDKKLSQSMLWKFGISGDLPIITVPIGRLEDSALITEVVEFMDYVKSRKIDLDIVVVMDEELYSGEPIKTHIEVEKKINLLSVSFACSILPLPRS